MYQRFYRLIWRSCREILDRTMDAILLQCDLALIYHWPKWFLGTLPEVLLYKACQFRKFSFNSSTYEIFPRNPLFMLHWVLNPQKSTCVKQHFFHCWLLTLQTWEEAVPHLSNSGLLVSQSHYQDAVSLPDAALSPRSKGAVCLVQDDAVDVLLLAQPARQAVLMDTGDRENKLLLYHSSCHREVLHIKHSIWRASQPCISFLLSLCLNIPSPPSFPGSRMLISPLFIPFSMHTEKKGCGASVRLLWHRIREWPGLKMTTMPIQFQPPAMCRVANQQTRLPRATSSLALNACRDGASTPPWATCSVHHHPWANSACLVAQVIK